MAEQQQQQQPLRVMELFAGVGGFRAGLEGLPGQARSEPSAFQMVWSNQWEPATKRQHASEVYAARWGSTGHHNENIFAVVDDGDKFATILAAKPDLLVAGSPCQDYSVANAAGKARGLEGKKGVLWWAIYEILKQCASAGELIKYLVLENVDRLVKSPTKCRGRDFAVILSSLEALGYAVEWRVVNAADYAYPQRRRRVFIVAYHRSTAAYQRLLQSTLGDGAGAWMLREGTLARAFPASGEFPDRLKPTLSVPADPVQAQATYVAGKRNASPFANAGLLLGGQVWSADLRPVNPVAGVTLGDIVAKTVHVPPEFYLDDADLAAWVYLKGAKNIARTSVSGHAYVYTEGAVCFPDALDRPSRTIITSEGGSAPSRFKHVIAEASGRLRRLLPEELEQLNGFPRGFAEHPGVSDAKRAFLMGNALVVGLVERIGQALATVAADDARSLSATEPLPGEEACGASSLAPA